jgi:hypothetical protein
MSLSECEYRSCVRQSILFLDEIRPDWVHKINLDILRIEETKVCILGQLDIKTFSLRHYLSHEVYLGFNPWHYASMTLSEATINQIWQEEIKSHPRYNYNKSRLSESDVELAS